MFRILVELADAPDLGGFRGRSRQESRAEQRAEQVVLRPPPGRLGIRWDEAAARNGNILVTSVLPGSAADVAGLRTGDRLSKFAGREVHDEKQFKIAVLTAQNPVPVTVNRQGADEPLEMTLELAGEPVRLGISWRTDAAEPRAVIVNRLTPGSPADLAGVHAGDRIYAICGHEFTGSDEFRQLATSLPVPLILEVEAAGRVRIVELPSGVDEDENNAPAGDVDTPSPDDRK